VKKLEKRFEKINACVARTGAVFCEYAQKYKRAALLEERHRLAEERLTQGGFGFRIDANQTFPTWAFLSQFEALSPGMGFPTMAPLPSMAPKEEPPSADTL
jgi:hypothetical protein